MTAKRPKVFLNFIQDLTLPFEFLMDATMLGVGVGFDCKGAGKLTILVGIKAWRDA